MNKPELLAPAGNLKKLKLAFYYGADAVYLQNFAINTAQRRPIGTPKIIEPAVTYMLPMIIGKIPK